MTSTEAAAAAPIGGPTRLLEATGISKRFAGIHALDQVAVDIGAGEMVGLIGPNGAGKTTLFNCLLGLDPPDDGTVYFSGKNVTRMPVFRRARMGMGRTFQRLELFVGLSVREHLLLPDRAHRGDAPLWRDLLRLSRTSAAEAERADAMLELLGIEELADKPVESLSLGRGRLVELGRALMTEPRLLLLDEPSSGLDRMETAAFANRLKNVTAERGMSVLLVEHDVDLVQAVVERIIVLDFGTVIASGPTKEVLEDATVRKAYLGDLV